MTLLIDSNVIIYAVQAQFGDLRRFTAMDYRQ